MKALGVICARSGSRKFPGKNLAEINGKPLLWYSIRAARASKLLDRFVVSTNSETIAAVAKKYGVDVPFLRPKEYSTDTARIEFALIHALAYCEEELDFRTEGRQYDCIVLLQNTSPLRRGSDIDGCIEALANNKNADSSATAHMVKYPHMLRSYLPKWGCMYPLQADWENIYRRQDAPPVYMLNGLAYAVRRKYLLGWGRVIAHHCIPYVVDKYRAMDIDDIEDMKIVTRLMNGKS